MNRIGLTVTRVGMVIVMIAIVGEVSIYAPPQPVPSSSHRQYHQQPRKPLSKERVAFNACVQRQNFTIQMKGNADNKVPISASRMILEKRQKTTNPAYKLKPHAYESYKKIVEDAYATKNNVYRFAFEVYMQCMEDKKVDPMKFIIQGKEA